MNKWKRIFALLGAVLLIFLYVMTFVTSLLSGPEAKQWLTASIAATVIVPIFLYAYILIARVLRENREESALHEEMFLSQMKEKMRESETSEPSFGETELAEDSSETGAE